MPLSDDKLTKMAEDVAVTRTLVEKHDKTIDTMQEDISDLRLAWDAEDTSRIDIRTSVDTMKTKIEKIEKNSNGGILEQLSPKEWKAILKWGAIAISFLVVGSAGGHGLKELIEALLQMLTVAP